MAFIASRKLRWQWLASLGCALALVSCGGGGSSDTGTKYTAVAMAGELLDYSIDTTHLTYSYTITESQFGLTGKTGSGTLVRNLDGTYSPSGAPNARVFPLPNGLLIGAVREQFGAAFITVPIIGLSNPVTTLPAIAGTYNFVQRSCVGVVCGSNYGSFVIDASGTWASCPSANLGTGACPAGGSSGTLTSHGNGLWNVMLGGTAIGTALGFNSAGQNVVILDLKDLLGGFGVGILVGSQQLPMTATQTDGTWIAGSSAGHWAVFTASGSSITVNSIDGLPINVTTSFAANNPWTGFATTPAGGVGLLAGAGVYLLETAGGQAELGIKIR